MDLTRSKKLTTSPVSPPSPAPHKTALPSTGRLKDADRKKAKAIIDQGTSEATRVAHESDLYFFWAWVQAEYGDHLEPAYPVPEEYILAFITQCLTGLDGKVVEKMKETLTSVRENPPEIQIKDVHAISTVQRRVYSLSWAHNVRGVPNPCAGQTVKHLLASGRRGAVKGGWRPDQKNALVQPAAKCFRCPFFLYLLTDMIPQRIRCYLERLGCVSDIPLEEGQHIFQVGCVDLRRWGHFIRTGRTV